jgi:glycosyltransferase involved in cell wall biosynthesis
MKFVKKLPKKKKYHILFTTSFGHMMGGGQWSLFYLIKHLDKDRFHPIVLSPFEGELAVKIQKTGAEVVFFNVGRIRHLNPLIIKKFISLIKERQIAIIHTDSTTETFYAGIAATITRIPLIWHIRVSDGVRFLDRILSLLSTKLILVADAISRRFPWLKNSHKMVVIYNGIDLEEFDNFPRSVSIREKFNINKETVLLGYIGRVEKRKGQEHLISAMRQIDDVKLILIGGGEEGYIKALKLLCHELGIADRVIFAGFLDYIPAALKEIDILVFPTLHGEGFPRVILETMAAGIPVVATDDGGNSEAVDDGRTGFIVPRDSVDALVEKISLLVGDRHKRAAMGLAGRARVERFFTIQKNVAQIQEIYDAILKNRLS